MALYKTSALAALLAVAEARFGQEQIPVAAVAALGDAGFGDPGVAATIAGSIPGSLLAAASPCLKLSIADQLITELGNDQAVLDAAIGLVSAETNFNPFAVDVPFVCADPALPETEALRGITPLVDPAVDGSDLANELSASSVATPFDATGLSQAEVLLLQGFVSFTAVDAAGENIVLDGQDGAAAGGNAGDDAAADDGAADDGAADDGAADDGAANDGAADGGAADGGAADEEVVTPPVSCGGQQVDNGNAGNGHAGNNAGNDNAGNDNAGNDNAGNDNAGNDNANDGAADDGAADGGAANDGAADGGANAGALDFGLCQPTIARVGGLNGRPADEFTFIPQDPLVAEGQQEALNPNIITNRICDQLTNVCEASDDAVAACEDAQAQIEALGTRDQTTADTWNEILGFAGVDSTVATI